MHVFSSSVCTPSVPAEKILDYKIISRNNYKLLYAIGGDSMPTPLNGCDLRLMWPQSARSPDSSRAAQSVVPSGGSQGFSPDPLDGAAMRVTCVAAHRHFAPCRTKTWV